MGVIIQVARLSHQSREAMFNFTGIFQQSRWRDVSSIWNSNSFGLDFRCLLSQNTSV